MLTQQKIDLLFDGTFIANTYTQNACTLVVQ